MGSNLPGGAGGCVFDAADSASFPYRYRHPNGSWLEQGLTQAGGGCAWPTAACAAPSRSLAFANGR